MKHLSLLPLLFLCTHATAQQCDQFPADCPDNDLLQQMKEKRWEGPADLKIKEEYSMQDSLRHFTEAIMRDIAKKKNWEYYVFEEIQDGGIGIDDNTKPLPYNLRRPCPWGINIVFIINKDSLHAWQHWYNNDLKEAANNVVSSYGQSKKDFSNNNTQKKYSDSATYYGNLKTKYMTDHAGDYQKAILSNDTRAQKKFEDEMKKYDDRINACISKANKSIDENFSASESQNNNLQDYRLNQTIAYRNASLLRIRVRFNYSIAAADEYAVTDPDQAAIINKTTKSLPVAGAFLSIIQHNSKPDNGWGHGTDLALLLFGKWNPKYDEYYSYHADFTKDKKNTDAVSVKKITCDKVQTININVEGNTRYINQFLQVLDVQKLNDRIVKG